MTERYHCGEDADGWYIAEFGSHEQLGHGFSEAFAKRVTAALNVSGCTPTEYLEGFAKSGISMPEALSITRDSLTRCRSDLRAALSQISELTSQFRFAPNGVSQIKAIEVAHHFMIGALAREARWPQDDPVISDAQIALSRAATKAALDAFSEYAEIHAGKPSTPANRKKVERNRELAELCRKALESEPQVCNWLFVEDDGYWAGDCGIAFCIAEETPAKNGMKYCPKCGLALKESE